MGKEEELHALERGPLQGGGTQAKAYCGEGATPRGEVTAQKHTAGVKASRRVWQITETEKEKCGYRAASKGAGLDTKKRAMP